MVQRREQSGSLLSLSTQSTRRATLGRAPPNALCVQEQGWSEEPACVGHGVTPKRRAACAQAAPAVLLVPSAGSTSISGSAAGASSDLGSSAVSAMAAAMAGGSWVSGASPDVCGRLRHQSSSARQDVCFLPDVQRVMQDYRQCRDILHARDVVGCERLSPLWRQVDCLVPAIHGRGKAQFLFARVICCFPSTSLSTTSCTSANE